MKILFLNAYFDPESIAFSHLEHDIIDELTSNGHKIHVVCPCPTRGISREMAKKYSQIKYEEKDNGAICVRRFWAPQEGKKTLWRAVRYLWCNLQEYIIASKMVDIDVIFVNSTPPTQGMLAGLVKRKLSKKKGATVPFVYCVQDIFPDSLVNAKMTKESSLIWKLGRMIENYSYKSADKIITISDTFKSNMLQKGVTNKKIEVIPNWVNTDNVKPIRREENILFNRYGLDKKLFYIVYSGNIGLSQNMDLLLEVAAELKNEEVNLRFVLIGDGAAKEYVEKRIELEKITNVILLPFQDYSEISHVFSLGDVGLIISKKGIGESSVPSKTWSIMAASRPILASFDFCSELAKIVNDSGCGIAVEADDVSALKQAIIELMYFSDRDLMGKRGREYLQKIFNRKILVEKYRKCIEGH